jgi:hypothetical protein
LSGTEPAGKTNDGIWPYLGVGCLTVVSGFFGGGMIAIMVAKVVGGVRSCAPDKETGAPCDWFTYLVVGACVGALFLPTTAIWRMRRGRMKQRNKA